MNFSSLQSSVQKFGMNQALKYLEKDPETNIPKLMNLVDKVSLKVGMVHSVK